MLSLSLLSLLILKLSIAYDGNTEYFSFSYDEANLVEYGPQAGDADISTNQQANGMTIRLYQFFPFYGAKYNYTMISTNGYIGFGHFSDNDHDFRVGSETNWPRESDPALIAPYLCKQRIDISTNSRIYYRMEMRSHIALSSETTYLTRSKCRGKLPYVYCNQQSNEFLDKMQNILQEGAAGGNTFRAEAALIVTWHNLRPNIGKERSFSTYQLIWMTDALGTLAYTIINYDKLAYDAADLNGNTVTGRCQAIFNGGNHTGFVLVDASLVTKERPSSLMERSAVPHVVRGRYLHRVDDIVRPVGCSNKTGGTCEELIICFLLNIYPNIVNMLGEKTVEIAPCHVLNPSIARCYLPKILDWGTKNVYFQPQSGLANDEKAYIGHIYFVPPTIDPLRLDIGNIYDWFRIIVNNNKHVVWYPRNFTNPRLHDRMFDKNDRSLYETQLGLYVIGYKESRDDLAKKFKPMHRVLARIISAPISIHWLWPLRFDENKDDLEERKKFIKEKATDICEYWFDEDGILPNFIRQTETNASCPCKENQASLDIGRFMPHPRCSQEHEGRSRKFFLYFDEFTPYNPGFPMRAYEFGTPPFQGMFETFRDIVCTEIIGSKNCYITAQNIRGSHYDKNENNKIGFQTNLYSTHYGQVCCYDDQGFLMQTSYQPVIKIDEFTPYNPGFPMRAYEFGTPPFQGMFEIPDLSTFYHDLMPYYFCCKFADFRCQLFYWRRPSSACQHYIPPLIGTLMGSGIITTLQNEKFVFNDAGIYKFLYVERTTLMPEVNIQIRMERFPYRNVDFSGYNQEQFKLVQPSNATVVTGVALESGDSDRVHVILRKDTRRMRYRTTILVNDIVRYFDNMQLQRYKGVSIYINNVQQGQAEVYVVLHEAQIGVRIRESYALDMDRFPTYMESFGFLDLLISVPSQYISGSNELNGVRMYGLIHPIDHGSFSNRDSGLTWNDINNPSLRDNLIEKYRIKGETYMEISRKLSSSIDMFEVPSDFVFSALPDINLKKPVYVSDIRYYSGQYLFVPQTLESINRFKEICTNYFVDEDLMDPNTNLELRRCPSFMELIQSDCNKDIVCELDSILLQAKIIGEKTRDEYYSYLEHQQLASIRYNSCGAITLEYPDYMMKGPSSSMPGYLEGDTVIFSCFQDHITKGDTDYQCTRRYDKDNVNNYEMRWNEGSQPWCRSRQAEDIIVWTIWSLILIGKLALIILIFLFCWIIKQNHLSLERNAIRDNTKTIKASNQIPLDNDFSLRIMEKPPVNHASVISRS
ncbi:unnamed protein product [Dracunculus medinensis]|uniref:Sushi domain-containing protein n=1 Tax=Dracunculus medinensis TaxID=318479 RepID=A0A158Q444_DRAME|nr:unnamed protein product [Dracunculus medinensis]